MGSLVSVIIATYNSSPFVVETLESITSQTWKELELIITDDCSKDDTVEVCTRWLNENRNKLVRGEIITSDVNTGVSANANRGLKAANGDWVKLLGADDTLKTDCIEKNMSWINAHPDVKVLFSRIEVYKDTFLPQNLIETIPGDPFNTASIVSPEINVEKQYKMLLLSDKIHFSPSVFLQREALLAVGGFDEKFKLLEDYPLWLNLTKNGHKLYFMDEVTVNYRRHSKAINNTGIDYLIRPNYFRTEGFRKLYTYPFLPADIRFNQQFVWMVSQLFRSKKMNNNSKANRFLYSLLSIYLNPFIYYIYLKKRLSRNLRENDFYK